uniref:Uncharacterized protein n=1 Tax=Cannabis sativa TaxID=3483 RepID=A0A803NLX9_CANSA
MLEAPQISSIPTEETHFPRRGYRATPVVCSLSDREGTTTSSLEEARALLSILLIEPPTWAVCRVNGRLDPEMAAVVGVVMGSLMVRLLFLVALLAIGWGEWDSGMEIPLPLSMCVIVEVTIMGCGITGWLA